MNDRRDAVYSSHSITGAATSFVSLSQESPTQEADGDDSIGTLKADEHSYLVPMISGSFSSEGTLKPGVSSSRGGSSEGSSTLQSTAPLNVSKSPENHSKSIVDSIDPYSGTFVEDDYDDEDDEDEDEGTNLWKMPLKQPAAEPAREGKRPVLSVDTEGSKRLGIYDNSNRDYQQLLPGATQNILNNLPNPSSFPTPTQRTRKPAANGSKRDSEFIKKSVQTWAFRPPPEDMYENLDVYFPAHDLDKPVIEATSGGSSPTAAEPSSSEGTLPANRTTNTGIRSRHKKSIRNVAAEHKRKIDRSSRADSASTNDMLRRRNTKLWGSKVEEVTPYQARTGIPPVPESPTVDNPTRKYSDSFLQLMCANFCIYRRAAIFKWVRGDLIGKGTYGRVYLALNVTTGEMIAVKQVEIPKTASDRDDSRQVSVVEALKLESETLKDLDHPNIVQYLGFEKTPDFLSM
jgi:mitogen-activated protein kinase kinase kinase